MDYKIDKSTKSDLLRFSVQSNEEIFIQPNTIVSKTYELDEKSYNKKSLFGKLATDKEKHALYKIQPTNDSGVLTVSPTRPGEIKNIKPHSDKLLVESNSFLASIDTANFKLNKKIFFKTDKLDMLIFEDISDLFISGFHGIIVIELNENQRTTINEKHLIALDETIEYTKIKGEATHSLIGPGKVYLHAQKII